jgi:hypothetical protein
MFLGLCPPVRRMMMIVLILAVLVYFFVGFWFAFPFVVVVALLGGSDFLVHRRALTQRGPDPYDPFDE